MEVADFGEIILFARWQWLYGISENKNKASETWQKR
jgi:hypothetical protein